MQQQPGQPAQRRRRQQRRGSGAPAAAAPLLALLCFLLAAASQRGGGGALALKVTVHSGGTECFNQFFDHEHFEVPGGPRVEGALFVGTGHEAHPAVMGVLLYAPNGELAWSQAHVDGEAHFNVAARGAGTYRLCFQSHSRADAVVDLVYFTLGHLRRPGTVLNVPKGSTESRGKELASADHLDEVRRGVLVVGELVDVVNGEQRYLRRKLDRHIQTCHSNNRRALWYTALEVATMSGLGALNVWAVARLFRGAGLYGGKICV